MNYALETRGLCKSFGGLQVTQSVDLRLAQGARHALIGPNGAGKTTLINLLTGTLQASSGTVWLNGKDITSVSPHRRVRHGLSRTFQISQLFPQLTVLQAVTLAACQAEDSSWLTRAVVPLVNRRRAAESAFFTLQELGLTQAAETPIGELPYGRQRLVEIALVLAAGPKVLLLDEPAAGIPEGESDEMIATLSALPKHVTVLLIEHDMDLVFRFATRISVLVGGALLMEGTPAQVAADPRVREVYLGRKAAA
jgi:branched-chain amino acid transport system ATP-binding protein